jgi:iron complex outermembrane recepter protein
MKQFFTFLTAFVLLSFTSQAQRSGKVTGAVIDGSQKTVGSATISLLQAKDSSAVKFAVAGKDGSYAFDGVGDGTYLVSVTAVGHQKGFSPLFEISLQKPEVKLGVIELVPLSKAMNSVTVVAHKPFIEQKIDRTVINVDAAVTNAGTTALEVLEKSPGITVDKDGNISLKGKQGVMILMDGRPAYLTGAELSNYLKNLPSSALEQIEIMTNPPAKYDAAGNAGIINIKTKKNKIQGFNGSVSLNYGQGVYWKTNNSVNLNFRTEKINVFANASQSQWNGFQQLNIKRTFRNANTKEVNAIFEQESRMHNENSNYNVKVGADYYLNKKSTVGFVASGFLNPSRFRSANTSYLMNPSRNVDSIVYATSSNNDKWKNGSINLNFRTQFDSAGTELTADVDYLTYSSNGVQSFMNNTYDPSWAKTGGKLIRSNLPIDINIQSAKLDFAKPFKSGVKLEAGLKTSFVKTTNGAFYYNVFSDYESPDFTKTNQFLYRENINAAYLNINKQFKKFGLQSGLRYENTNYNGKQFGNKLQKDSMFSKSYGNLFPTVFVSYNANKNNQFGLSLGRRIQRPAYQDLNPFLFFIDEYTYQSGNPFIRPQFTNNVELTHTFKSWLTTTLNYNHTKDYHMETFTQEQSSATSNGYATIVRRGNIGKVDAAGVAISANVPVAKWWNAMLYSNLNYSRFYGELYGENLDLSAANVLFNVNNQFRFSKGWGAELSGFYRTRGVEGQIMIQPMGQTSAGISKQIMKGKGTVKLNVRDMFYTNRVKGEINFKTTEAHFENFRDSRVANFTFTYRFGKPLKGPQPKRKIGGANDEQNRVKVGGNG